MRKIRYVNFRLYGEAAANAYLELLGRLEERKDTMQAFLTRKILQENHRLKNKERRERAGWTERR